MTRRIVVAAAVAGLLGGWAGWAARGWLAVDACVDAGGKWQSRGGYCEGADRAARQADGREVSLRSPTHP